MERHRAAWTTALALALALMATGSAAAFQFKSCVSVTGAGPCASAGGNTTALDDPRAVVVSPDGKHVYAGSFGGDAIGVFARDPGSGALTFQSCVSADGSGPCTIIRPGGHLRALDGPRALVISPDGKHLYVAAGGPSGDAISFFSRNPDTGALGFVGCMTTNNEAQGVCVGIHSGALDDPSALAISPDGDEVYVAAENGDSIGYFSRNQNNGQLAFFSCRGVASLCTTVAATGSGALDGPSALAVSRDGTYLYTAGRNADAIGVFRPDTSLNSLAYLGCYGAIAECTSIGNTNALDGPSSLAVSQDNSQLFVAAGSGNALGSFNRNQGSGLLGFVGCDGATNLGPCTAIGNGNALTAPAALALSPGGGRVYSAAGSGNALGTFARSPSDDPLAFLGCVSANGSGPCTSSGNANAFSSPSAVAASPDGRDLYVTASAGDAIAVLGVAPPSCAAASASTPYQTPVRLKLECGEPDGDAVSFTVGGVSNGVLSELDPGAGTVLFTPSPGFSGQAAFDYGASDIDGSSGSNASIAVGAPPFVPPPAPPARILSPVINRWAAGPRTTEILRLRVRLVPGNATVQVRCAAPKRLGRRACPFRRKSATPKADGATVDVRKLFGSRRRLRVGVKIQIRITAPGAIGKVVTYTMRRSRVPRSVSRCIQPGATAPSACT
jgi:6-phosphogluconolactonase (cycloisomerase 2 family)